MGKKKQVLIFIVCLVVCFGVSGVGAMFTTEDSVTNWYAQLRRPKFTPPDWIFGPVWTFLYFSMAVSAFLIWRKGLDCPGVRRALGFFIVQLVLNVVWTPLFFGFQLVLLAFIEIVFLWLAILATLIAFKRVSLTAGLLLIPYVIWVGFAVILNGSIWSLNR